MMLLSKVRYIILALIFFVSPITQAGSKISSCLNSSSTTESTPSATVPTSRPQAQTPAPTPAPAPAPTPAPAPAPAPAQIQTKSNHYVEEPKPVTDRYQGRKDSFVQDCRELFEKWSTLLSEFEDSGITQIIVFDIKGTLWQMIDSTMCPVPGTIESEPVSHLVFSELAKLKNKHENLIIIYASSQQYIDTGNSLTTEPPIHYSIMRSPGCQKLDFSYRENIIKQIKAEHISLDAKVTKESIEATLNPNDYFMIKGFMLKEGTFIPSRLLTTRPHILISSNGQHIQFNKMSFQQLNARPFNQTLTNWCNDDMLEMMTIHQAWENAGFMALSRILGGLLILEKRQVHDAETITRTRSSSTKTRRVSVTIPSSLAFAELKQDSLWHADFDLCRRRSQIPVINLCMNKGVALQWLIKKLESSSVVVNGQISLTVFADGYTDASIVRPDICQNAHLLFSNLNSSQQERMKTRFSELDLDPEHPPEIILNAWDASIIPRINSLDKLEAVKHDNVHVMKQDGIFVMLEKMLEVLDTKYLQQAPVSPEEEDSQ